LGVNQNKTRYCYTYKYNINNSNLNYNTQPINLPLRNVSSKGNKTRFMGYNPFSIHRNNNYYSINISDNNINNNSNNYIPINNNVQLPNRNYIPVNNNIQLPNGNYIPINKSVQLPNGNYISSNVQPLPMNYNSRNTNMIPINTVLYNQHPVYNHNNITYSCYSTPPSSSTPISNRLYVNNIPVNVRMNNTVNYNDSGSNSSLSTPSPNIVPVPNNSFVYDAYTPISNINLCPKYTTYFHHNNKKAISFNINNLKNAAQSILININNIGSRNGSEGQRMRNFTPVTPILQYNQTNNMNNNVNNLRYNNKIINSNINNTFYPVQRLKIKSSQKRYFILFYFILFFFLLFIYFIWHQFLKIFINMFL